MWLARRCSGTPYWPRRASNAAFELSARSRSRRARAPPRTAPRILARIRSGTLNSVLAGLVIGLQRRLVGLTFARKGSAGMKASATSALFAFDRHQPLGNGARLHALSRRTVLARRDAGMSSRSFATIALVRQPHALR
jgi:hypothetical protein